MSEDLSAQLEFLENQFKVIQAITTDKCYSISEIPPHFKHIIEEKDHIISQLQQQMIVSEKEYKQVIQHKEHTIDYLQRELEFVKSDNKENEKQLHNLLRDIEGANRSSLPAKCRHLHISSLSSLSSRSTFQEHTKQLNYDKLLNEKMTRENQLLDSRLQYAELSANMSSLESDYNRLFKTNSLLKLKIESQEKMIQKLSKENDLYKLNISSHYQSNVCSSADKSNKKEEIEAVSKGEMIILEEYISLDSGTTISIQESLSDKSKSSKSIINYFKNILSGIR